MKSLNFDEEYTQPENTEVLLAGVDGKQPYFTPVYEHPGDGGADLKAAIDFTLEPFERKLIPTGICLAIPRGYMAAVYPRSGLAIKKGISLVNAPGLIDAGYRGEIKVPIINLDPKNTWEFHAGERIAQLVIQRYVEAVFVQAQSLPGSERGESGFGSTGV